jgi:signal transduction histidine kinase
LNALRPVTWAAALLVLGLIAWSLGQWGGQYPAPPYYFLAPLVMAMALLDGILSGTVVAVAGGALVLWTSTRSPMGSREMDQAIYMMGTLFLALFASGQALLLHRDLDRRLADQGAALQRALRLRRRLLGTLFHDLSNPLAMLQLAVELGEGQGLGDAERVRMQCLVDRMQSLVASARDFVAIDGPLPKERLQAVALGPLLNDLREQLQPRLQAAGQELRIYCAPQLQALASPVVLRESVVSNLLKLAMARCGAGAKLTLSVTSQADGVVLKLQDPGRPLSQDDLAAIGSLPQGDEGSGVTLALVHEHLLRMGGGLALANLDEGGSMATVLLSPID